MKEIIVQSLQKGTSYATYRLLVSHLVSEGKSTGNEQSESLSNYSFLNDKRMKRLDKTLKLSEEIIAKTKKISQPQTWLVITESWCGDAAQTIPIIHKVAQENSNIDLKIVLRDENEALMNMFLTNGNKSIPKLIVLNAENEVLYSWGPRPSIASKMVASYIAKKGSLDAEFKQNLQIWYNQDKGKNTQKDLMELIK